MCIERAAGAAGRIGRNQGGWGAGQWGCASGVAGGSGDCAARARDPVPRVRDGAEPRAGGERQHGCGSAGEAGPTPVREQHLCGRGHGWAWCGDGSCHGVAARVDVGVGVCAAQRLLGVQSASQRERLFSCVRGSGCSLAHGGHQPIPGIRGELVERGEPHGAREHHGAAAEHDERRVGSVPPTSRLHVLGRGGWEPERARGAIGGGVA
mmetsp:Transcript_69369/g.185045  ORF Transcript_69369/g.185045 Transcript_69369/m.185045 type:complete len:209 (-) Transcript_69369:170-796(-)